MFPQNENPERGYIRMVPWNENRGTRVRSHVPPKRKPERGYVRQNHPFTKPPSYLSMTSKSPNARYRPRWPNGERSNESRASWATKRPDTLPPRPIKHKNENNFQGRANHEVHIVNWNTGIWGGGGGEKVPDSRFALHGLAPPWFMVCSPFLPLIHGLCAFVRPLLTPISAAPSLPASQFTVCTSRFTRLRNLLMVIFRYFEGILQILIRRKGLFRGTTLEKRDATFLLAYNCVFELSCLKLELFIYIWSILLTVGKCVW